MTVGPPGRPRDPPRAVPRAPPRELLVDVGYGLSIAAIASASGHEQAGHLSPLASQSPAAVRSGVPREDERLALPVTGVAADDLAEMLRRTAAAFASPVARAHFRG